MARSLALLGWLVALLLAARWFHERYWFEWEHNGKAVVSTRPFPLSTGNGHTGTRDPYLDSLQERRRST